MFLLIKQPQKGRAIKQRFHTKHAARKAAEQEGVTNWTSDKINGQFVEIAFNGVHEFTLKKDCK